LSVRRFEVLTLFPSMFDALTGFGISGRAFRSGLCRIRFWDPRDYAEGSYRQVDDRPYGGGPGMVMMVEPLERALDAAARTLEAEGAGRPRRMYLSPQGRPLTQALAAELAGEPGLILLAGRYEGVDERLFMRRPMEEVSVGDYVLSGGEFAVMVLLDAIIRLLPGALGDSTSSEQDSFAAGLLDCPHYTRPEVYEGLRVPEVLLSGNHERIRRWRLKQALLRTRTRRPDLLKDRRVGSEEAQLLREVEAQELCGPTNQ
jgi:tRNA (guanine37-N1)-methyltransferase